MTIRYIPILKSKAGELRGLAQLSNNAKKSLAPLLELQPIDWDYDIGAPKATVIDHATKIGKAITKACAGGPSVFVDSILIDDEPDSAQVDPLEVVLQHCRASGVKAMPVTGLGRPVWQVASTKAAAVKDGLGACVRLTGEDMTTTLSADLQALLAAIQLKEASIDLVLDLGEVAENQLPALQTAVTTWIASIPNVTAWRSFFLAGTGFPINLTGIQGNTVASVPRSEWVLWQWLYQRRTSLARFPRFSDYGIAHPDLTEMDPRIMQASVSLRYTANDNWLVLKGRSTKNGFGQMRGICDTLRQRPEYSGRNFSAGDEWIDDCATGVGGTGNLTTYRQVGTNHHLELVVHQLSTIPGI